MWASLLYANAPDVTAGERDALGSILRFQGGWNGIGRGTESPGTLNFRVEHRTAVGGLIDPGRLSGNVGMGAQNTGFPYSDSFDADLAVLSWKQVIDDRWGFDVGRLAFDVYADPFFIQTTSGGFLNCSFVLNPSMGAMGIGALGAVAKGFVADGVWIGGQVYGANAVNGEFDLDTLEEGEFLTLGEIGWTSSRDRVRTDRVQFSFWSKDARDDAGTPSGHGWVVSASSKFGARTPFTRFGHSDGGGGAPAEAALALGAEWEVREQHIVSLGYGWADLSDKTYGRAAADESVGEASWRWQATPALMVMPDLQYLKDPANSPTHDSAWVLSLRLILSL